MTGLKILDWHRVRTWYRHIASGQHTTAVEIESQPKFKNMFIYATEKPKELTFNFLRISYSRVLIYSNVKTIY